MDLRFAMLCCLVANALRNHKEQADPFQPSDFFPSVQRVEREPASPEEIFAKIEALAGRPTTAFEPAVEPRHTPEESV